MSSLEKLPTEIFQQIIGYLAFIDKKALSLASRRCHALVGQIECPDKVSWIIHVCHFPRSSIGNELILHPEPIERLLEETASKLMADTYDPGFKDANWHPGMRINLQKHFRFGDPNLPSEPLLVPYFNEPFPKSTFAHAFFRAVHNFAAEAIPLSGRYEGCRAIRTIWRRVEEESQEHLEWLAQRKLNGSHPLQRGQEGT